MTESGLVPAGFQAPRNSAEFPATHWSVVLAAGESDLPPAREALERLCGAYWYPLYAYARRRRFSSHDAEDLVQGFLFRLIGKGVLTGVGREGGRFRSFLLTCFNRFLSDEHDRVNCQKRGGGQEIVSLDAHDAEERYRLEPPDLKDPVSIFERRWALTVLDRALGRLRDELAGKGQSALFRELQGLIVGEPGTERQAEIAARLGLSEGAVNVTVHRLRQAYRRILRDEISQTVGPADEVDHEMRHLRSVLRS